jgi:hypothetical protein
MLWLKQKVSQLYWRIDWWCLFFRVRMGQVTHQLLFYLGIDVSGDLILQIFYWRIWKVKHICFLHKRFCENRFSPSQTSWLNGTRNNELFLVMHVMLIFRLTVQDKYRRRKQWYGYLDRIWFTEESLKAYILSNFRVTITGNSGALYGFTSTSQF